MTDRANPDIAAIYDKYSPQIYRYLYHRLGNGPLAEDLTAEVFVRLVRSGTAPDNVAAYLYRCAHNLIVDYLRENPYSIDPLDETLATQQGDPAHIAELDAERVRLRRAISLLTADQQQVIALRFVEGFSIGETAQLMGRPEGAAKALQHRALVNLRNLLDANVRTELRLEFAGLLEG